MGIKIIATGRYVPERVLTNADLEKMVETSDEWIRTRTGIETRHIADASQATSDMCREAAKKALEMAGIAPSELGAIVVATITPDHSFPNTACLLQEEINGIHKGYPAIPEVAVDGIYGPATQAAVKKIQSVFGLPATGIVDYPTWYKISEVYVGVSRIAELD